MLREKNDGVGGTFGLDSIPDGQVKIYYGAADTAECLATARVDDLFALRRPFSQALSRVTS